MVQKTFRILHFDIFMLKHLTDRALFRIFGCGSVEDIAYIRTAVYLPCVGVAVQERSVGFLKSYCRALLGSSVQERV